MVFNDEEYTEESIIKQLALVEQHTQDGSVLNAGCHCVEGKHLFILEGLSNEGATIMESDKKRRFLAEAGPLFRAIRRNMESDQWDMKKALHEAGLNPGHHDPALLRCIADVSERCMPPKCNPYAVCRASVYAH